MAPARDPQDGVARGSAREVFASFLRLGLTSFGGPVAHLGYLRRECVDRRGWLDDARFAQLVALCQFLPGPASSQLGFAIGLQRAGWRGGVAAFVGFTLPSALLMAGFALLLPSLSQQDWLVPALHGLKLLAVAVVAHGLAGMARTLTPDARRIGIALAAAVLAIVVPGGLWPQLAAIAFGAAAGLLLCRAPDPATTGAAVAPPARARVAPWLLATWACLLAFALAHPPGSVPDARSMFAAFYRAGSLVFGGGHVVLPLLHEAVVAPGWLEADRFLAGYGASQAVPGPMFTISAFLGASLPGAGPGGAGAAIALAAIFLPGLLLVAALLPLQARLMAVPSAARVVAGINAAVVGLLAAALYDPLWREGVRGPIDLLVATVALVLLASGRVPVLLVVAWCVLAAPGSATLA